MPWNNQSIDVCFDQGSEMFWVFGPQTDYLWGGRFPPGTCSSPVGLPMYDYQNSPRHPELKDMDESFSILYGGGARSLFGNSTVTDTMMFSSSAGQVSTIANITGALPFAMFFQQEDTQGRCDPKELDHWYVDRGILGISKYKSDSQKPHVRHDLLERGAISNQVQSMWFDEAPEDPRATFTGGAIFGGVDMSKFTGPLVKVSSIELEGEVGYYVSPPRVSVNGKAINDTGFAEPTCHLDCGTTNDALPITTGTKKALLAATGLVESANDNIAWNGTCDSVPRDLSIDLTFPGARNTTTSSSSVTVKVPLRNYVRQDDGTEKDKFGNTVCRLSLYTSDEYGRCVFGAPFATAAFFAADDEKSEIALAQGGVSLRGSGPDDSKILARIPDTWEQKRRLTRFSAAV